MKYKTTKHKKRTYPKKMIDAARELYLKYGGRQHARIEREMQDLKWEFSRRKFYSCKYKGGVTVGWPLQYGWRELLGGDLPPARDRNRYERWLADNFPEWNWSWPYQRLIYRHLDRVTSGKCRRLMIFMPPRHGKSETVTVRYTAWRLLQTPAMNTIIASYNQRLADKFSRKIRRIYLSGGAAENGSEGVEEDGSEGVEENGSGGDRVAGFVSSSPPLLPSPSPPLRHSPRLLKTAAEWETPGGGIVRSVGVGGGIAGFGADLVVIDDPIRSRADAESEANRDRIYEWFNDDIYTRLEPNGAIILIQTRWHEDDLAGRLLREQADGGEKWEVVCLPALAERSADTPVRTAAAPAAGQAAGIRALIEANTPVNGGTVEADRSVRTPLDPLGRRPGEALCPRRYDVAALERFRRKLGSYSFAALYQQDPHPAEGGQFKREWFRNIVDSAPAGLRWVRGYDLAVSLKTTADYTASFRVARDKQGNIYIADGFRKRIEYPEQRRFIIERMQAERNTQHCIEAAVHGRAIVQDLRRERSLVRFPLRCVPVRGDKLTRALAWLNLAEAGKVILVRGPWIEDLLDELARFPTGAHDDQIDAVSLAVQSLSTGGKLYFY